MDSFRSFIEYDLDSVFFLFFFYCSSFEPILHSVTVTEAFFSDMVFFHGLWSFTGQQGKEGIHTHWRTFRDLLAILRVKWLTGIFNGIACNYQTANCWDFHHLSKFVLDWSFLRGFRDSVPVCKIHDCYWDTQKFQATFSFFTKRCKRLQRVDKSKTIQKVFKCI